ncbi:hypothetical protein JX266_000353 [Neoarthrinium moseri]|nr:hypothetical protein JX266_000353 [Neoarthrinium moseri]
MRSTFTTAALSALTLNTIAVAESVTKCSGDICFSAAVPTTSSSGNGNLYFQISGPTSYTWLALGSGDSMASSYMFVMYTDGSGNVTVSPRLGTNHQMPSEDTSSSAAKVTLLAGSGVNGDTMVANFVCSNCQSLSKGSVSASGSSDFIAAWKSGPALDSSDKDAAIAEHDSHTAWAFNLQQATISSDANPFVASGGSNDNSGSGSGSGSSGSGNNSGSSSSGVIEDTSNMDTPKLIAAHGVVMAITFVILYPIGSILMPMLSNWVVHAMFQTVAFLLMWAGFALGVISAHRTKYDFTVTHTLLGTVVVCLMVLQPALGWVHHTHFVKHQKRSVVSYAHIAYGRSLMLLGVINGGLGLQLAGAPGRLVVAYAVVSAVIGVLYAAIKLTTSFRKRRGAGANGGSKIPGRRGDKYAAGQEVEMPHRPYGNGNAGQNGHGY